MLTDRRDAVLAALKGQGVMASKLHHRIDGYTGFAADPVDLPGTAAFLDRVSTVFTQALQGTRG